jgi:hypothetical protein
MNFTFDQAVPLGGAMDPNIYIGELERIVEMGAAYKGPHGDSLAHAYGVASVLRDIASTDEQREDIAAAVVQLKGWFKANQVSGEDGAAAKRQAVAALIKLKRAFGTP